MPTPTPTPSPAPVTVVGGVDEYLSVLRGAGERLVVLKVFAPWCRSCRALEPKIARLSREFRSDVVFAKINFEQHKDLCYRLGVSAMPTFVFYKGAAGEIDKFSCGPQRAPVIREKIVQVLDGVCQLADRPC